MNVYLAGPLFTAPELAFNRQLRDGLEHAGHSVWLPQEQTAGIVEGELVFKRLIDALDTCDVVVANMDGADPDSGTSWECGYAFAKRKPTVLFRSDIRSRGDVGQSRYNLMMWASATSRLDGPFSTAEALLPALVRNLQKLSTRKQQKE